MSFERLIHPRSIAVVGASTNPGKVGYSILKNIIDGGFTGDVYPVNPTAKEILGRACFPSLKAIPAAVDCAVIVVKRDQVLSVLTECSEKAILSIITITAGFK
jgi:acetyltransferase